MEFPDVAKLNSYYGTPEKIAFREGPGGFPVIALANGSGACEVSLYGGHVLSYRPIGHVPVLFMSKSSLYEVGKPIRGGIPVCWPWFGAHPDNSALPMHGFARVSLWNLAGTDYTPRSTEVSLRLDHSDETLALWPHKFRLTLRVTLEQFLRVELTTRNMDEEAFVFSEALHSYFMVRQIVETTIRGLEGAEYADKTQANGRGVQDGPIVVGEEFDKIYVDTDAECVVEDAALGREITVSKEGSKSTVVWNPWIEKAQRMADFGDDEYKRMVCVETANAFDNKVTLEPGATHSMAVTIRAALKE